jgi:outer membrane protein, multidrug efflux system
MSNLKGLAVLTLPVLLGACTSALISGSALPSSELTAPSLSRAFTFDRDAQVPLNSQWWGRFNDPLLGALVDQALQANTSIRSAKIALQQSRALRDVQNARLFPAIAATGSGQRNQQDGIDGSSSFRVGIDASWEPDVFGARRNSLGAAQADVLSLSASFGDVKVSISAEVALAYIQLRNQQMRLMIARNNFESQNETLQIAVWRAQAGLITSVEVEQARNAAEQTAALIPAFTASIKKSQHALAVLLGQDPATLEEILDVPTGDVAIPQVANDLALEIPAQTLRQRPDIRAAEQRIRGALARVSVAQAARYPGFSIGGSIGLSALTLTGLTQGASLVRALLGSVTVPLFDGGLARAQTRAQEAILEQARLSYETVVLISLNDVADALVALKGDQARLVRLEAAADAASNAARLAQNRFTSGLIDFQIVLQTQRALLTSQDSLVSAKTEVSTDHVRLFKALGGGWSPEAETGSR